MKRPSFQFYPADWRKDAALQSCSIAARGLWLEAMCVAHECEPYGHLTVNGKRMTTAQIARLAGVSPKECEALFAELDQAGVTSRDGAGTIFSRRMVRDEDLRNRRATGGKEGAEHGIKGAEAGIKGGRPPRQRGVTKPPLEPPPSSSSSSSASTEEIAPPSSELADSPKNGDPPPPPPDFDGRNAETLNGKAVIALSPHWELPEAWGIDAEALGWQPREVLLEAEKFRQYWTAGKGAGTRRAVKGWRQTWSNWLGKAAERKTR